MLLFSPEPLPSSPPGANLTCSDCPLHSPRAYGSYGRPPGQQKPSGDRTMSCKCLKKKSIQSSFKQFSTTPPLPMIPIIQDKLKRKTQQCCPISDELNPFLISESDGLNIKEEYSVNSNPHCCVTATMLLNYKCIFPPTRIVCVVLKVQMKCILGVQLESLLGANPFIPQPVIILHHP